jgi:hypothetical protein
MSPSPKHPETTQRRWLFGILLAGTLLGGLDLLVAQGGDGRDFFFNPDPGTKLLAVQSIGSSTGVGSSYTLYADGRLEISQINYKLEKSGVMKEHRLSFEEASGLIRRAVDAGIMEWNDEKIRREMQAAGGSSQIVHDGATMHLEIHLEGYRGLGQEEFAPASATIVFESPTIVAKRFPQIEEIQTLALIAQEMRGYAQMAKVVMDE